MRLGGRGDVVEHCAMKIVPVLTTLLKPMSGCTVAWSKRLVLGDRTDGYLLGLHAISISPIVYLAATATTVWHRTLGLIVGSPNVLVPAWKPGPDVLSNVPVLGTY